MSPDFFFLPLKNLIKPYHVNDIKKPYESISKRKLLHAQVSAPRQRHQKNF